MISARARKRGERDMGRTKETAEERRNFQVRKNREGEKKTRTPNKNTQKRPRISRFAPILIVAIFAKTA